VSESASGAVNGEAQVSKQKNSAKKPNIFARIALFVRQVIAELKKVVTPTRKEFANYWTTVVIFVLIMMAFVLVVDWLLGKGAGFLFG
jgi:preprotein translocase subunit SecE